MEIMKEYIPSLKSFWHSSKYILFSISISITIIFWDYQFVSVHFPINKFLAVFMMSQVELSYIVLPYMVDYSIEYTGFKKYFNLNKIMRVVFFIASMTPAALGVTDMFLDKIVNAVKTEPTIPTEPKKDAKLEDSIAYLNYKIWKEVDVKESQIKLDKLEKQKSDYLDAVTQFNKDTLEYPKKKQEYEEYKKKGNITFIFDYIMLALGFIIMVSLQVMNGYASTKGAKSKKARPRRSKQKQPDEQEQLTELDKPDIQEETTFSSFRGEVPVGIPHNRG